MTKEQAIETIINSRTVLLWEADKSLSDRSTNGMMEVINALEALDPTYHVDKGCIDCLKRMLDKAVRTKNEHILHFHKFPKQ